MNTLTAFWGIFPSAVGPDTVTLLRIYTVKAQGICTEKVVKSCKLSFLLFILSPPSVDPI